MKVRKKPVVVDAWHNVDDGNEPIPEWMNEACAWLHGGRFAIETREGTMTAELGDWIIRGVKGEVYPIKPDIFAETYDILPDPESQP